MAQPADAALSLRIRVYQGLVCYYMDRLGLIPSRPAYETAREARWVHAQRKLDGYARHGTRGVRALTERARVDALVPVTGRGEWTKGSTSYHYKRLGRKVPRLPPKWTDEDVAEMVELKREGKTTRNIAEFFRTTWSTVYNILRRRGSKLPAVQADCDEQES
jgi:hypothetical protein